MTDRSGTPFKDSDSLIRHAASAACRTHGGGTDQQVGNQPVRIPDTETARLLIAHGFEDPATICTLSAAPRDVIIDAYHRRMEVGGGPGLEATVIREGRWTTCGQHVDTSPAVPLDGADAGHDKYIGGALGRYIRTGLDEPPPDEDVPGTTEPERYHRDAEHALIDGWVPPGRVHCPRRPTRRQDDDPEVDTYRSIAGVPAWGQGGAA